MSLCIFYFSSTSCSTCFEHLYAPHQEVETILVFDVWLTVHSNSVWIRKTIDMSYL